MSDCIFCKIISGELPSEKIMETDNFLVFDSLNHETKIHFLIVPKVHYKNILEAPANIWSEVQEIVKNLEEKYKPEGFRISSNIKNAAHIQHMHFHFLAPVTVDHKNISK